MISSSKLALQLCVSYLGGWLTVRGMSDNSDCTCIGQQNSPSISAKMVAHRDCHRSNTKAVIQLSSAVLTGITIKAQVRRRNEQGCEQATGGFLA